MGHRLHLAAPLAATLLSACTVTRMGAESGPPRLDFDGMIEGHAAFGIRADDDFLRLRVLDGESDGALGEFVLWKLFRLEVGALGVGVGIGPVDLALGTLFYEPEVPRMTGEEPAPATHAPDPDECELCRQAEAKP